MPTFNLSITMSGPSASAIADGLRAAGLFPPGVPIKMKEYLDELPIGDDWFERAKERRTKLFYSDPRCFAAHWPDLVMARRADCALEANDFVARLAGIPFELASF